MKYWTITVLASLIMLQGCATVRTGSQAGTSYTSLAELSQKATALGTLTPKNFINAGVDEKSSPSLNGEKLEIVQLEGVQGGSFTLEANALCDCLGFRKWSVDPKLLLLDGKGNVVQQNLTTGSPHKTLSGVFPNTGTYKLVVIADKTNIGQKISTTGSVQAVPGSPVMLPPIPITAHPVGTVQLSWSK